MKKGDGGIRKYKMEEETRKKFNEIEERLLSLEGKRNHPKKSKPSEEKKNYKGLAGGIRLLINKRFLSAQKSVNEVWKELKKEEYHYPKKSVEKLLSVNFTKNKKILNRFKEEKKWKYVIRK